MRLFAFAAVFVSAAVLGSIIANIPALRRRQKSDLAAEARGYLREKAVAPLQGETNEIVQPAAGSAVATHEHRLLGKSAPEFTLEDDRNAPHALSELLAKGPVVLVFYYGYHCNHCVAQLFALHDDVSAFEKAGAQIIAVSADSPADTRERFTEYGRFKFPVLSDPDNLVAAKYGVFEPAANERPEKLQHGTFVIDRGGIVRWCNLGEEPFINNAALLSELAKTAER